jgi:hypothetical protein
VTGRVQIELAYGRSSFEFHFDKNRFSILTGNVDHKQPLSDFEIGASLTIRLRRHRLMKLQAAVIRY